MYNGDGETTARAGDIAALESAVTLFRVRPRGARPAAQLRGRMLRLRHLIDVLELEFAKDAASLSGCDELEWQGHISPIQWVKHECRTTTTAAIDACDVGVQAALLPESVHALLDGAIGFGHLALLARTAEAITSSATSSDFEEAPLLAKHGSTRWRSSATTASMLATPPTSGASSPSKSTGWRPRPSS
jgi:hypothetical protein